MLCRPCLRRLGRVIAASITITALACGLTGCCFPGAAISGYLVKGRIDLNAQVAMPSIASAAVETERGDIFSLHLTAYDPTGSLLADAGFLGTAYLEYGDLCIGLDGTNSELFSDRSTIIVQRPVALIVRHIDETGVESVDRIAITEAMVAEGAPMFVIEIGDILLE